MGYYSRSRYRGDYYRGDYYRGDPGLFDDIVGGISDVVSTVADVGSAVLPVAGHLLSGVPIVGPAAEAAGGLLGGALGLAGRVFHGGGAGPRKPPLASPVPTGASDFSATQPGYGTAIMPASSPWGLSVGGPSGLVVHGAESPVPMPGGAPAPGNLISLHRARAALAARRSSGGGSVATRHVDSWSVKAGRRMNPLNPRALRRAIRRARGFEKYAKDVLHFVAPHKHVDGFKVGFGRKKRSRA